MTNNFSFIIPVYNEEKSIKNVIEQIKNIDSEKEIIVIDDCSNDETQKICTEINDIIYKRSLQNFGYGHSIKEGIKLSKFENIVILDGDNTYPLEDFSKLKEKFNVGYDMVIGKRVGKNLNLSPFKGLLRSILKIIVEFSTGEKIPDINSGYRIFKKKVIEKYLNIMCDTFSFSTSMTLVYIFQKKSIAYIDIPYKNRIGKSKVKLFKDSLRTLQYISELLLYFNPLKFYLIISFILLSFFLIFLSFFGVNQPFFSISLVFLFSSIISVLFGFLSKSKNG
jgi:polyisoprenyl-phosphate glycosyltransferase